MEKRGAGFFPGRAGHERKEHISRSLNLSPDSDFADLRLELWGEGKARVVFDVGRKDYELSSGRIIEKNDARRSLVKIDKGATEVAIRDVLQSGGSDISKETRERFSQRMVHERFARKAFYAQFGDFVLPEKVFLRKIPLSRDAISAFYPDIQLPDSFPFSCELSTLVYVQQKAPREAFGLSSRDVLFRCAERGDQFSDAALFQGNRTFLDLHASWHDVRQFAGVSPEIQEIIKLAEHDHKLRVLLRDFVTRAYTYTRDTGEVLDLFGSDNVRLFRDGEGFWRMVFLDAYTRGRAFAQAREAIRASLLGYEITTHETLALVCSLNYARNMNALAFSLNAPERFQLSNSDISPVVQKMLPSLRKVISSP